MILRKCASWLKIKSTWLESIQISVIIRQILFQWKIITSLRFLLFVGIVPTYRRSKFLLGIQIGHNSNCVLFKVSPLILFIQLDDTVYLYNSLCQLKLSRFNIHVCSHFFVLRFVSICYSTGTRYYWRVQIY